MTTASHAVHRLGKSAGDLFMHTVHKVHAHAGASPLGIGGAPVVTINSAGATLGRPVVYTRIEDMDILRKTDGCKSWLSSYLPTWAQREAPSKCHGNRLDEGIDDIPEALRSRSSVLFIGSEPAVGAE
jgi:hypothetical protein